MKFILAKKIGMTQTFDKNGNVVAVTLVQAGPCKVTQVKNGDKEGYTAVQIGLGTTRNLAKPQKGHLDKAGIKERFQHLREFIVEKVDNKVGDELTAGQFQDGDEVVVVGTSKGKGFQGVVKKYHFAGGYKSHGHRHEERSRGSIGQRFPQHTFPGTKMAGRMGNERITQKGLMVSSVDAEKGIIAIKGTVPGTVHSLLAILTIK